MRAFIVSVRGGGGGVGGGGGLGGGGHGHFFLVFISFFIHVNSFVSNSTCVPQRYKPNQPQKKTVT